jgi:hypothetical protein
MTDLTNLTIPQFIEMADYILENDRPPNGMVLAWRNACITGSQTYRMLELLKEKYDAVKANESVD